MNVFISCVKSKRKTKAKARDIYISPLFRYSLKYALSLTSENKIYILSAKYGLLKLDEVIDPYELTLNTMSESEKKKWAYKVYLQMKKYGINFDEDAVFLTGKNYRKYLITKFSNATAPLKNLGLGMQLNFYKNNIK
jgi:hypothetical protein